MRNGEVDFLSFSSRSLSCERHPSDFPRKSEVPDGRGREEQDEEEHEIYLRNCPVPPTPPSFDASPVCHTFYPSLCAGSRAQCFKVISVAVETNFDFEGEEATQLALLRTVIPEVSGYGRKRRRQTSS